ncbi:hypothetical protein MK489_19535 [Myxococcota bacterium]|nr:hypothetical protein [Myxococcota bacterium]
MADRFELTTNREIREMLEKHTSLHHVIGVLSQRDVEDMQPFLPANTLQVVDLCCGTGRVSIALDKLLLHGQAKFWLVDGHVEGATKDMPQYWDQYENDSVARFYNKRDLTEELCRLNSFSNYEYLTVSENLEWSRLPENVDFLFSNRAIGCHFPLAMYEDIYPRILRDGAVCMFMNRPALGRIPDYFEEVAVVQEKSQGRELIVLRYTAALTS